MNKVRIFSIVETLCLLLFFTALNLFFGDGTRWVTEDFHPYWIVILLITVQYGTVDGMIAVLLSTLFLYAGNLPKQGFDESSFSYQFRLVHLPFYWFVTAFILGELRMRSFYLNRELKWELTQVKSQAATITETYEKVKGVKEKLEERIAGEMKTLSHAYRALKNLEMMSPAKILISLDELVTLSLNPKKFSIWAVGPNGFEATICQGWEDEDAFDRRLTTTHPIYQLMIKTPRMLSVINEDDEEVLKNQGVLAAPLIDAETHELFGLIKIEEMEFHALNLSNLEIFHTLCQLIGSAFSNAKEWKAMQRNLIYSQLNVYSQTFIDTFSNLSQSLGLTGQLIHLSVDGQQKGLLPYLQQIVPKESIVGQSRKKPNEFALFIARSIDYDAIVSHLINEIEKKFPGIKLHFKKMTNNSREHVKN